MKPYTHKICYYGIDYAKLELSGVFSPVISVKCSYKSMVHFGEYVEIAVKVEAITNAKLTVNYTIIDCQTRELRAIGQTSHCFINTEGKVVSLKRHSPELYNIFALNLNG